ncbi:MAG: MAPEG family protein [Myxococcales bacterium]|nr:MAPEG family protein [Myxococcales bacterium]MCB9642379.1 MAPEG family protein [Myxococcales bacterium]
MTKVYAWPALATLASLAVYYYTMFRVSGARYKYKVPVPQTTGNLDFERFFRVQQNTVEQLVFFVPALWLFSFYVSPMWGGILGGVWALGRFIYAQGYYAEAKKRGPGFAISSLTGVVLWVGALINIIRALLA